MRRRMTVQMADRNQQAGRGRSTLLAGLTLTALTATIVVSTVSRADGPRERRATSTAKAIHSSDTSKRDRIAPIPARVNGLPIVRSIIEPIAQSRGDSASNGVASGACDQVVFTHSSTDFSEGGGGEIILQAGFVEDEIAAASFELDPSAFPVILNKTEMIFGQVATVETITQWSWLVWEGTPNTGTLIAEQSSADSVFLQPIIVQPASGGGAVGVNVAVEIDSSDPDQIVINDNGSHTFTIGYRIDQHNNQPSGDPCLNPPPESSNLFPTTDSDGVAAPADNWLKAIFGDSFLCCPGGWTNFQNAIPDCTPSGDWSIRATYTPTGCDQAFGGCCFSDGACAPLAEDVCVDEGGVFQGDGSECVDIDCPEPVGACCFGESNCSNLTEAQCTTAGGVNWGGPDSQCDSFDCDPSGACCLPDGTCVDGVDPTECQDAGGAYQGNDVLCAEISCPEPTGACCLPTEACFSELTEANCLGIPEATWAGPNTTCNDDNDNGQADSCETANCPADLDGTGVVDVSDLLALLGEWGTCGEPCSGCEADIDDNCAVDVQDLLELLGAWGPCE